MSMTAIRRWSLDRPRSHARASRAESRRFTADRIPELFLVELDPYPHRLVRMSTKPWEMTHPVSTPLSKSDGQAQLYVDQLGTRSRFTVTLDPSPAVACRYSQALAVWSVRRRDPYLSVSGTLHRDFFTRKLFFAPPAAYSRHGT